MNSLPLLFLGVLFTMAASFWGMILVPHLQVGRQQQIEAAGERYPYARPGRAAEGLDVYRANGCAECHTIQVRPEPLGSDIERGWGERRTVAQDYLYDYPLMLGSLRLGPDLANIGVRQTNATWYLLHLYSPRLTSPGSMMPPYKYLFEKRKLRPDARRSPNALPLDMAEGVRYEIVPKPEAFALVEYLLSLRATAPLPEAPLPQQPTNDVPAEATSTNASPGEASQTNATEGVQPPPPN